MFSNCQTTDNNMSDYDQVKQFHRVFGHPIRESIDVESFFVNDDGSVNNENLSLCDFRMTLIQEEWNEFKNAFETFDFVEMADGLLDVIYVVNGFALCLGININDFAVNRCAPSYLLPFNLKEYFKDTAIYNLIKNFLVPSVDSTICNIYDLYQVSYLETYKPPSEYNMVVNLVALLNNMYMIGHLMNFDMKTMFCEVHRSNMSKMCKTIEDAQETVAKYAESNVETDFRRSTTNDGYVVFNKSTSKILKNHKWFEPNLEPFVLKAIDPDYGQF
jgi:predicted HAD superfamily Cof-like phosphohydrolase